MKRKYNDSTLNIKLKALKELEAGSSQQKVAVTFGVATRTLALWTKNKENIIKSASENANTNSKRAIRISGSSELLDERVYNWFAMHAGQETFL